MDIRKEIELERQHIIGMEALGYPLPNPPHSAAFAATELGELIEAMIRTMLTGYIRTTQDKPADVGGEWADLAQMMLKTIVGIDMELGAGQPVPGLAIIGQIMQRLGCAVEMLAKGNPETARFALLRGLSDAEELRLALCLPASLLAERREYRRQKQLRRIAQAGQTAQESI